MSVLAFSVDGVNYLAYPEEKSVQSRPSMTQHWYELRKIYDGGVVILEQFRHDATEDGVRDAKARMIARIAVARTVDPEVKFRVYAYRRELLEGIE